MSVIVVIMIDYESEVVILKDRMSMDVDHSLSASLQGPSQALPSRLDFLGSTTFGATSSQRTTSILVTRLSLDHLVTPIASSQSYLWTRWQVVNLLTRLPRLLPESHCYHSLKQKSLVFSCIAAT